MAPWPSSIAALVFAVLTLLLARISEDFVISGPDDWSFLDFYKRYLIISAVYTFVALPTNPLLGIPALAVAYKFAFDAGLKQALVIGTIGGVIAMILFRLLIYAVLTPFGLV